MSPRTADPVEVVEYDEAWPREFERLARRALDTLAELAVGAEHIGSTAVPGLAAKPVVDLYVLLCTREDTAVAIERLESVGYRHEESRIPGRAAFNVPAGEDRHHLYLSVADDPGFCAAIGFRDHLRLHPADADEYAALKRGLAELHRNDRVAYGDAKSEFIERILAR